MEDSDFALSRELSALVQSIYQGARDQRVEDFQDWALEQVKSIVYFDSAIWVSGALLNGDLLSHSIQLHNQPPDMLENYARYEDQDLLRQMVMAKAGETINTSEHIPRESLEQLEIYQKHAKPYGMEHTLSTAILDHANGLYAGTSFYRADIKNPFTLKEKKLKQFITPILVEARKFNLFITLSKAGDAANSASAISDRKGIMREAEHGFSNLICQEWPTWKGPALPIEPDGLLGDHSESMMSYGNVVIHLQTWSDLVRVQIREKGSYDQLTPAEQQVALHLIEGMANKEIATHLNISPKTVDHHLQSIYKKTNTNSRTQAVAQLKPLLQG